MAVGDEAAGELHGLFVKLDLPMPQVRSNLAVALGLGAAGDDVAEEVDVGALGEVPDERLRGVAVEDAGDGAGGDVHVATRCRHERDLAGLGGR
ncbi:MAG: hypothetical protein R3F65_14590 [bacterium]